MGFIRNVMPFFYIIALALGLGWIVAQIPRSPGVVPEEQKKAGLFVLNVLDKDLYEDCHIKGSIHIPLTELEKFAATVDKEKSEIVVYCSNYLCSTSEVAVKKLTAIGFKNVWAYEGGTAEWFQLGLPIEGSAKNDYLTKKVQQPPHDQPSAVLTLTAQELAQKLNAHSAAA